MTQSIAIPLSLSALAWSKVLGKPSNKKPLAQSFSLILSFTKSKIKSSGTNSPFSIISLAFKPRSLLLATAARNISPVDICGIFKCLDIN